MIKSGLYGLQNILGAKVRVISSPGFELFGEKDNEKIYFVKKVDFRVEVDGKLRVGIVLDGLENKRFAPSDLMIIELGKCEVSSSED